MPHPLTVGIPTFELLGEDKDMFSFLSPKSPHFIPVVDPIEAVSRHPRRRQTIKLLESAAKRIGEHWPQDIQLHAKYRIVLAPENIIAVQTTATESLTEGQALVVGIDAFHALAARLNARNPADLMDVAVATLAHETFHLGQMQRIRGALAELRLHGAVHEKTRGAKLQASGFAQGVDDEMSTPWKALALGLAVAHPERVAMPMPIAELSDIVSELHADITALNILKATKRDGFGAKLLALRIADAQDRTQYQIGNAMQAILSGPLPTERDAAPLLWAQAATRIAALDPVNFGPLAQAALAADFYRPPTIDPAEPKPK